MKDKLYMAIIQGWQPVFAFADTEEKAKKLAVKNKKSFCKDDKLPNFDRKIKVQSITKDGYIYNMTDRYDGDLYPFWAIKDLKIIKGK